jgi:hypothetical protein
MTPALLALFVPACLAGIWTATRPFPQRARYADKRTDWQPAPQVAPLSPVAPRRTLASSPTLTPDVCNVILFPGGR